MLNKGRTAIVFTANTPHLAHANLMLESLRDPKKGNFSGDVWVISTGLSNRAQNYLDSQKIKYLISNLNSLYEWKEWKNIAKAQPEFENLLKNMGMEDALVASFELYRNKRMSKLILLDWVKKFGEDYDFIALGDNDLYFQRDIHELFDVAYSADPNKIHYWQEENEILPGSWLWKKDFHYARFYDVSDIDFGKHEINIGFILGQPNVLYQAFSNVKKSFFNLLPSLFISYHWHDQDLIRLDRAMQPERYALLEEGSIVHLCNGGDRVILEKYPGEFYHKKTENKPYMIHFAGGAWKNFPSIKDSYMVQPDNYYFSQEVKNSFDVIRRNSLINIFDEPMDKYYTEDNKLSKKESRKKWLELSTNGKPKFLFIGWLKTGTHKSTYDAIPDFFKSNLYDLAVLNGNNDSIKIPDLICEDFPILISQLTRITKDNDLIRIFGVQFRDIPEKILADCIRSAMIEYRCTERSARALSNLLYLYFSDALEFYNPNLVTLWGFLSPWGKLIQSICGMKGIPICSLEWGVLPGTVSFDFCGHMGDSWVTRESKFFNKLSIEKADLIKAQEYLEISGDPELSRNTPKEIDISTKDQILELKKSGKKIILYMESNSAHSGNTFVDLDRAKMHSPFFQNDIDAYEFVLNICKKHEDWHIVYKPHPISLTRGIQPEIDLQYTTILYTGGLNEALDVADLSITILSQSAYVSLLKEIPTLLLGKIQLNSSGAAYVLSEVTDLEELIITALAEGYTDTQREKFKEHVARLLKYYVYSANPKVKASPINLMKDNMVDIMQGKPADYYQFERKAYETQVIKRDNCLQSNPKVSIIMPVYNAEEYLAACVASVCNQTLKELELICINNGSTDESATILNYYAARDSRILIHYQEEPNQRTARNWGIRHARGKYLYFMDSDDFLDSDALEKLVETAEERSADLLYFFFREVRTDLNTVRPRPRYYNYKKFLPEDKVFKLKRSDYNFFIQYPFPWAKLIHRDLVLKNNLIFDNDCSNFDDNPHNLRTLLSAENPYVFNEAFYNFRIHNKSMTQSKNPRILGMIDAVRIMNQIYKDNNVYLEFQKWYVPYKVHLIAWAWDLLPEELRENYYTKVKDLFISSDMQWFVNDEVWSCYGMPSQEFILRVKRMLSLNYKDFMDIENKKNCMIAENKKNSVKDKVENYLKKTPKLYKIAKKAYHLIK